MRRILSAMVLAWWLCAAPAAADEPDLSAIFAHMEEQGAKFDARRLHELGVDGLEAVFDRWLPQSRLIETKLPLDRLLVDLIASLGHEDYDVRTQAAQRLILLGEQARAQVAEASRSSDPEVRLQANTVLHAWKKERTPSLERDERQRADNFRNACYAYLREIEDDERLEVLVRRTRLALKVGLQPHDSRTKLRPCLKRIAALKTDRWCSELLPLLTHDDPQVPVFVVHSLGAARQNDFFPTLLVEALASERPEIVEAALSWTLNCSDPQRREALQRQLRKLLDHPNEALKFQACWPLIHDFQDELALEYVLTQAGSDDVARARTSLGWIAEAARGKSGAPPEVLERLTPLLSHGEVLLRRDAAQTLAAFGGEEAVCRLIPLLNDESPSVAQVANDMLVAPKDRELKRKLLEEAAESSGNPALQAAAAKLLVKLAGK